MPLLDLSRVVKDYGGARVLDHIDLSVNAAEPVCLIGPNGCGKSTLFHLVAGAMRPTSGDIRFDGRPVMRLGPHRVARLGVGRKFQVPSVFDGLTVRENLMVCAPQSRGWPVRPSSIVADRIEGLLQRVRLSSHANQSAESLSAGQKQWLEIAMALMPQPRLLLLDEPTAGMTAAETRATVDLIHHLCADDGIACLIVEHDMRFVAAMNARVLAMVAGSIVADGAYEDVRLMPEVRSAYLGSRERLRHGAPAMAA